MLNQLHPDPTTAQVEPAEPARAWREDYDQFDPQLALEIDHALESITASHEYRVVVMILTVAMYPLSDAGFAVWPNYPVSVAAGIVAIYAIALLAFRAMMQRGHDQVISQGEPFDADQFFAITDQDWRD